MNFTRHSTGSGTETVALLDDDPIHRLHIERSLRRACSNDFEIHSFERLCELESAVEELAPDLILADLGPTDASGVEVIERIMALDTSAATIVMTDNSDPAVALAALERGAQDFLVKNRVSDEVLERSVRYSMARAKSTEQLSQIARELATSNRQLERYAGIVAHDLRAPVRTSRLLADRLVDAAPTNDRAADLGSRLDECLNRLEVLIEGLLRISTLQAEDVDPELIDIADLVAEVRDVLSADLEACGAQLVLGEAAPVWASAEMLRVVLLSVIENSLTYRSHDRSPDILIDVATRGRITELRVADNGIGIEPEYRERVFRLFERLHNDPTIEGVGFGLAVCQHIVELHRGSLRFVEPRGGIGATLTIELPSRPQSPR